MSAELEHRDGEPVIVTPVATILDKIQREQAAGFARVEKSLEGKADKVDIMKLETTVREHGDRLLSLEQDRHTRQTTDSVHADDSHRIMTKKQARWTVVLGGAVVAATIIGPIIANAVH